MEFQEDFSPYAKDIFWEIINMLEEAGSGFKVEFDDLVERLDVSKQKGVFVAFEEMLITMERIGLKLTEIDFQASKPIRSAGSLGTFLYR
ncbi:MAG: hypothetical protein HOE30_05270 [Deltaproteobacteria bacterium]|nr:hypothetical protein [Deltaproteobacteria bacterium]MBT4269438.1 hypothetical protein [Deltaproteobacteria bacterium]MBT6501363.1 hypothetical protein [Deltaproteobacteria bacterium]